MNTLGKTYNLPKLSTITLLSLLAGCTAHDDNGNCYDLLGKCPETGTSHGEHTHATVENHEGQISIDFNITNTTLGLFNPKTQKFVQGFDIINTNNEGKAFFDLSTFQVKIQALGNEEYFIIPNGIEVNGSSTIQITNGYEYLISDFSNGIVKVLDKDDLLSAVNNKIDHSPQSLVYGSTAIDYPQELEKNLHRFNKAVSLIFGYSGKDINGDGDFDYSDITENLKFSQYANDCIIQNSDGSITINYIPPDQLYSAMENNRL